jgi:ABC-type transport system involved in cytochrome c biogenesis permease component
MIFLLYVSVILVTTYVDALACVVCRHKYSLEGSLLSAIFWPVTLPIVIYAVVKETKEY